MEKVLSPEEFLSSLNQSETYFVDVTLDDVIKYTQAARDDNPLHFGEEGNVVPGGLITSFFLSNPHPGFFVRNYQVNFRQVTHFPATVKITRTMTDVRVRKFGYTGQLAAWASVGDNIVATAVIETFKPSEQIRKRYERG